MDEPGAMQATKAVREIDLVGHSETGLSTDERIRPVVRDRAARQAAIVPQESSTHAIG
jgi:hypothetical protein